MTDETVSIRSYPPQIEAPLYFGCIKEYGHYAFAQDSHFPKDYESAGAKWLGSHDGRLPPQGYGKEGLASLRRWPTDKGPGVTVLAFWDNSIDDRPNSSSNFMLPGLLEFDEAVSAAREAFPNVWARYKFEVKPDPNWPRKQPEKVEK